MTTPSMPSPNGPPQPPPAWDPYNEVFAPELDAHTLVVFISPGAPPGVVGITLRTRTGELTALASKDKAQAFADGLRAALSSVAEPSGLLIPTGAASENFARSLRLPNGR